MLDAIEYELPEPSQLTVDGTTFDYIKRFYFVEDGSLHIQADNYLVLKLEKGKWHEVVIPPNARMVI